MADRSNRSDPLDPVQVEAFLRAEPSFLIDHPELLDSLELSHKTGGTSLIERQVARLRDENASLKQQLEDFRAIAVENQDILERMHRLQLELVQAESFEELLDRLADRLAEDFDCRLSRLALWDGDGLPDHELLRRLTDNGGRELFEELISAPEPEHGRLRRDRLAWMFGSQADGIASAVFVPLDPNVPLGLLALASARPEQFHPGVGTLFLKLLAQTLGHCLAQHLPDGLKQQA
ncbi:MAG: DUF484 family protein [Pseudomonadota bacterium]